MKNTKRRSITAGESKASTLEGKVYEEMENEVKEESKPDLPEGYYPIENIRKKRVKKGEVKYMVKWLGWPESANTWEPIENLASVRDVVDAFEQRMQLNKFKSSQKRRGRPRASPGQAKRRQSPNTTVSINVVQDPSPLPFHGARGLNNGSDNHGASSSQKPTQDQKLSIAEETEIDESDENAALSNLVINQKKKKEKGLTAQDQFVASQKVTNIHAEVQLHDSITNTGVSEVLTSNPMNLSSHTSHGDDLIMPSQAVGGNVVPTEPTSKPIVIPSLALPEQSISKMMVEGAHTSTETTIITGTPTEKSVAHIHTASTIVHNSSFALPSRVFGGNGNSVNIISKDTGIPTLETSSHTINRTTAKDAPEGVEDVALTSYNNPASVSSYLISQWLQPVQHESVAGPSTTSSLSDTELQEMHIDQVEGVKNVVQQLLTSDLSNEDYKQILLAHNENVESQKRKIVNEAEEEGNVDHWLTDNFSIDLDDALAHFRTEYLTSLGSMTKDLSPNALYDAINDCYKEQLKAFNFFGRGIESTLQKHQTELKKFQKEFSNQYIEDKISVVNALNKASDAKDIARGMHDAMIKLKEQLVSLSLDVADHVKQNIHTNTQIDALVEAQKTITTSGSQSAHTSPSSIIEALKEEMQYLKHSHVGMKESLEKLYDDVSIIKLDLKTLIDSQNRFQLQSSIQMASILAALNVPLPSTIDEVRAQIPKFDLAILRETTSASASQKMPAPNPKGWMKQIDIGKGIKIQGNTTAELKEKELSWKEIESVRALEQKQKIKKMMDNLDDVAKNELDDDYLIQYLKSIKESVMQNHVEYVKELSALFYTLQIISKNKKQKAIVLGMSNGEAMHISKSVFPKLSFTELDIMEQKIEWPVGEKEERELLTEIEEAKDLNLPETMTFPTSGIIYREYDRKIYHFKIDEHATPMYAKLMLRLECNLRIKKRKTTEDETMITFLAEKNKKFSKFVEYKPGEGSDKGGDKDDDKGNPSVPSKKQDDKSKKGHDEKK